jgi:hypothetical protein
VSTGEACDDGDGQNSNTEPDACRLDCQVAACGDGVVDAGEECDDGNSVDSERLAELRAITPEERLEHLEHLEHFVQACELATAILRERPGAAEPNRGPVDAVSLLEDT